MAIEEKNANFLQHEIKYKTAHFLKIQTGQRGRMKKLIIRNRIIVTNLHNHNEIKHTVEHNQLKLVFVFVFSIFQIQGNNNNL